MEYKEYGHWSEDGREYIITERKTPRHWYNYYFNDTYNAFASQVGYGEGFCQDDLGNREPLVTDRCVYICDKDSGAWHTACALPMSEEYDLYECHHGLGYSTIICEKNGIRSEYTVFVPAKGNFEEWIVQITNKRNTTAKLSTVAFADTACDGKYTPQGYNSHSADKLTNSSICASAIGKLGGAKKRVHDYMLCSEDIIGYDTRRNAFIGTYGSKTMPEALCETNGCTDSPTCTEKICFALEADCTLLAGQSKEICFRVGHASTKEEISALCAAFTVQRVKARLDEIKAMRACEIDGVIINTPDENLNLAFNSFYKYATNMGSRWARVRHNGYRDIVSDTECFGAFNPEYAWARFKRILSYQYSTGYCPRTFIDGKICPNNFSDCAVWITFAAYSIVMELGDTALLSEEVKFNDGTSASVFEHLRLAVEYLYNFQGMHGLIKIWGGDWNDGMNGAGLEGKGVSVWLSIAWYRANKMFIELAKLSGRTELVSHHEEMGEDMRRKIETYGYDGKYYITAINDKGVKIGSQESKEGKMYLNPQLWAVFSGIAPKEKLEAIMQEVDTYLDTPLGTLVNRPGYTSYDPTIGSLTAQPLGTLINEAVYLHPMAWKLAVECILKRPKKLQETLYKILPWNNAYAPTCGEPYILYNFYHGEKTGYRYGTPGQSWRTASTQWVTKSIINFIFGLKPTLKGLAVDPCLPPDWKDCSITKKFRGCIYDIHYHNAGSCFEVDRIIVDGKELFEEVLPSAEKRAYKVEVYLK